MEQAKRPQSSKNFLVWGIVLSLLALAGYGVFRYFSSASPNVSENLLDTCVTHAGGMHIHPNLKIVINGEIQEIDRNIGVSANCMRPIHTHDNTRKLHTEFPRAHEFTLGDFFTIWDKQFSQTQIFEYAVDDTHSLTMKVNDAVNTEFEKYVMKDGDDIVIEYSAVEFTTGEQIEEPAAPTTPEDAGLSL